MPDQETAPIAEHNPSPPVKAKPRIASEMRFDAPIDATTTPSTANEDDRTIDVVWYSGASVPRTDYSTGKAYKLRLDMAGAKLDRLNAGAPVFDAHQQYGGTQAVMGVVRKAWADGPNGKATLQFKKGDPDADRIWNDVSTGVLQKLSFGAWINNTEEDDPEEDENGMEQFVATDWEPFEISPVPVPADFNTQFLSAQVTAGGTQFLSAQVTAGGNQFLSAQVTAGGNSRATSPQEHPAMETNNPQQGAGDPARENNEQALATARAEAIKLERERVQGIQVAAAKFSKQLPAGFVDNLVNSGTTLADARTRILEHLAGAADAIPTHEHIQVTRDKRETVRQQFEAACFLKFDPSLREICGADKKGAEELRAMGREFQSFSLVEMARHSLEVNGTSTKGRTKDEVVRMAMESRIEARDGTYFAGSESTSDFPAVLANVANKTLRQAYEAAPQTFRALGRMVTAADFKPINRVQLSDSPSLEQLGESGEIHRSQLKDSNSTYSLATYAKIVAITRKAIINDDLQAFTRIPAIMGVAAARTQSDVVWGLITSNPTMGYDNVALFNAGHGNLQTGGGSALQLSALATMRQNLRLQTAPQGTILNLTPRYLITPAALETAALQLISPLQLAATAVTGVVPEWVQSLVPVVEPRLDANSSTAWYLFTDTAMIDTFEYCFLEGQEGVYTETRQGFDVDGVEIKVRMDFAAGAIDHRGMAKAAGA